MRPSPSAALLVVALPLLSSGAHAQAAELYRLYGPAPDANFGFSLASIGDLDGDGLPDLLIGASNAGLGAGHAFLVSGVDGTPIHDWSGNASELFGSAVCGTGDVTGDGVPDVAVGGPWRDDPTTGRRTGAAYVYSGADGSLVRVHFGNYDFEDFGIALANAGDLDGDGVDDLAIGGPDASFAVSAGGAVYVYSGASGAAIDRIDGAVALDGLGAAIASTGDLDQDGVPDLAVGIPYKNTIAGGNAGAVVVYSGADRSPLFDLLGDQRHLELGRALAGGADLDGDGVDDLLVGAPKWTGAHAAQGCVRAYSGATHAFLWEHLGERADDAMGATVAMADRDGDGVIEVVVTAGSAVLDEWRVERLAPRTGVRLYSRPDPDGDDRFGAALAILDDVDGDGVADVAIGASDGELAGFTDEGLVTVHAGARLWLNAAPKEIPPGTSVTTTIGEGAPGHFTIRFVWDVNGTLVVLPLPPLSTFDAQGFASFVESAPAGLAGITVTLRAFAILANGRIGLTHDERLMFL